MAIQDRNLAIGTQLYARYKGATHTAEVIEKEGKPTYRVADGREFKSPSAAGTAITGLACNGWAFWTVGDGPEPKPAKGPKAESSSTITPAPKPQGKRRGKKSQEPPASDGSETADEPPATEGQASNEARDDAPTAPAPDDQPVTCAECGETFPGVAAATEHYYATHGKPEGDEPTA
jgi:hypothetical protein